jgi:hypothetical protein
MYVAATTFAASLCAWQSRPPTVDERSEWLANAVEEYQNGLKAAELRAEV